MVDVRKESEVKFTGAKKFDMVTSEPMRQKGRGRSGNIRRQRAVGVAGEVADSPSDSETDTQLSTSEQMEADLFVAEMSKKVRVFFGLHIWDQCLIFRFDLPFPYQNFSLIVSPMGQKQRGMKKLGACDKSFCF